MVKLKAAGELQNIFSRIAGLVIRGHIPTRRFIASNSPYDTNVRNALLLLPGHDLSSFTRLRL